MAVDALLKLIVRVGDESNLTLDPDIDTYYLMDTLQFRLPMLLDVAGRAADRADRAARTGRPSTTPAGPTPSWISGRNLGVITDIDSALTRAAAAVVASDRIGAPSGPARGPATNGSPGSSTRSPRRSTGATTAGRFERGRRAGGRCPAGGVPIRRVGGHRAGRTARAPASPGSRPGRCGWASEAAPPRCSPSTCSSGSTCRSRGRSVASSTRSTRSPTAT